MANDYPNFEVVVIDNGSTDGTKEWVGSNYPNVTLLRTDRNLGYSGGLNFGMKYAFEHEEVDYVLLTNNDVKVDSRAVTELVNVAETDSLIGFVTGKVFYFDFPEVLQTTGYLLVDSKFLICSHRDQGKDDDNSRKVEELFASDDIFMLVSKKCYDLTGGYDELFKIQGEQYDWQLRAKKKGFKVFFSPYAKIWHKDSMTIGKDSPQKLYYNMLSLYNLRQRHLNPELFAEYRKHFFEDMCKMTIKNFAKFKIVNAFYLLKAAKTLMFGAKTN